MAAVSNRRATAALTAIGGGMIGSLAAAA